MAVSSARWLVWRVPGRISDMFLLEGERGVSGGRMGWTGMGGKGMGEPLVAGTKEYSDSCESSCFAVAEGAAVGVDADGFGLRES